MVKTVELESVLREAIEVAIQHGAVLMHGEYGVTWDATSTCWTWDRAMFTQTPHCDCIGAFMITTQPELPFEKHKGDIYDAAMDALKVDKILLRDLMNGFDDMPLDEKGHADVHALGTKLRKDYRPVCFEYIAINSSSGVRTSNPYRNYLIDWCLPAHLKAAVAPVAADLDLDLEPAPPLPSGVRLQDPTSGVFCTISETARPEDAELLSSATG